MPVSEEYWFARRFPIGQARMGMAPVHWKGWAVVVSYAIGLLAAAAAATWLALTDQIIMAAAVFIVFAFVLSLWFIGASHKKGDHARTVADYRQERSRV